MTEPRRRSPTEPRRRDPNGKFLLHGVKPITEEQLFGQGHRYASQCPDYASSTMFMGQSVASALSPNGVTVPVVAMACTCGAIVKVPLS